MLSIGGVLIVVYRSREALLTVGTRWHHLMRPAGQLWSTENFVQDIAGNRTQLCKSFHIALLALYDGYGSNLAIILNLNTSQQRHWIVTK